MTELTMTELAIKVWEYVGTDPRTEDEIASMLVRQGTDPDVASRFTEWCAGRGYIRISPGTCGKRWTTKAAAKKAMQEAEE